MIDNVSKISDIEMQRQINRAVLISVGQFDEKGFTFGKNRIGSVLKGHKHKYILDNKLDTFRYYGLSKNVDFKVLMSSIEKLINHGYLAENRPGSDNEKFEDDAGNVLSLTEKGKKKLDALVDMHPEEQNYAYNTDVKQKLDYSITEIVSILRSENESCNPILKTERKYRILHLYFGRLSTMEEIGNLLGVSRERIRQLIQKEIVRLNDYDIKQKSNLFNIDSLYRKMPKKPFIKNRKQEFEILMMYHWLNSMTGDEENYWQEYLEKVLPAINQESI